MHGLLLFTAVLGTSAFASSQAAPSTPNPTACGRIASSRASTFPGSLAYECLRSVPNRIQPAQQLIQSLKAFVDWQSTHAWLKNPPKSYGFPAVDVQGDLDEILQTVTQGGFESEYDFQAAIVKTLFAAHDGHFFYTPDVFGAFSFQNRLAQDIVSVSIDGTSLPKLYRLSALDAGSAAPIALINGDNATDFIVTLGSQFAGFQDSDAQWNSQFPTYANPTASTFWGSNNFYLGPEFAITYENGSVESADTTATLKRGVSFSGIATGNDFYETFCTPVAPNGVANEASTSPSRTKRSVGPRAPIPFASPRPIVRTEENTTMGFFLNGNGFDDVAVLAITAFEEDSDDYLTSFQDTIQKFLAQCRSAKKQRLVIDLTSNGGGLIAAGFELFAQLFPGVNRFTANNMRLTNSLANISQILSTLSPEDQKNATDTFPKFFNNISPGGVSEPQGVKFNTVQDITAPVVLQNDRFTQYIGEPFTELTVDGDTTKSSPSPFKPENIVLLTDGACSSTCTTFSYLMLFQERVKTVSVGGRPQNTQMQSLGGVEGGQSLGMRDIAQSAFVALSVVKDRSQFNAFQQGDLGTLSQGYAILRAADIQNPGGVNLKNNFSPSDSKTPLQFLYEPANCRFFYTYDMLSTPQLVWQYAVDASWTDPARYCVPGSRAAVDGPRPIDPAFAKDDATKGGSGGGVGNGGNGASGAKDDDNNAAEGLLAQGCIQIVFLLAGVSVVMLCL
ncbi:hypothetical protein F5Y11DRAFT_368063 [Daldinia sp. FL1419]|nr:hypothetical protein F5Y11DRAFT_368063 [Daldinia sp. FL1419]